MNGNISNRIRYKSQLSTFQINCGNWNGYPLSAESSKHFKPKKRRKIIARFFFHLLFYSKWHLLFFFCIIYAQFKWVCRFWQPKILIAMRENEMEKEFFFFLNRTKDDLIHLMIGFIFVSHQKNKYILHWDKVFGHPRRQLNYKYYRWLNC